MDTNLPYYQALRDFERKKLIPHRNNIYGSGPPSPVVSEETLGYITTNSGHKILDIGCGIGTYLKRLNSMGHNCTGIENNEENVKKCQKNKLKVKLMDAQNLKFKSKSFDTVLMIEVLEHLPNPHEALKEAFRVAKKNILISVPNIDVIPIMSKYQVVPWHMLEKSHLNFFTPKILENTLEKFTIKLKIFTYAEFAPWIKPGPLHMHIFAIGQI